MSNSPEDFPLSTPDAGGNPQKVQPHLEDVPYAEMTLKEAIDAGLVQPVVDPNTLQQVQEKTYRSERPPAIEPAMDVQPASKNNKLRNGLIALGAGATAIAIAAGAWIGLSGDKDDTTPKSETTATAPAQPTSPVETKPVQTTPGEAQPKPVDEWKFYNEDGSFQTTEQVKKAAAANPELRSNVAALDVIFEHAESAINYVADQKTVMDATGKPADQLTLEDYRMVTKQYQELTLDTVVRGNGQLRQLLDMAAADTTNGRFANDNYRLTINQDFIKTQTLTITDNASSIGAQGEPERVLGTYRVISKSGDDVTVAPRPAEADPDTYVASYTVDGSIGVVKKTK